MGSLEQLLSAIDEITIARNVGNAHDQARMHYRPQNDRVESFDEFTDLIADYYNYHFTKCISSGGTLSRVEASGRAKEILSQEYRRKGGDIISAYNDAHDGTNQGLRGILDLIADRLKTESVERYIRDQFDRHVAPNDWEKKVEIIRQFIQVHRAILPSWIETDHPERYARDYEELIRAFVSGLQQTSSIFRRL